jgi:RNA polymerase sigma-70 factor (ECF subfamily)
MRFDKKDIGMFSDEDPNKKKKRKVKVTETQFKRLFKEDVSDPEMSFEDIYEQMYDKMFNQVCKKYTKDVDKAQEFCQQGFLKVWKKLDKYNGSGSLEGWVRFVIKNTVLDELRKEKMKFADGEDGFDFERLEVEDEPYEEPDFSEEDVKDVLHQLPPTYREVFDMYYFQNMKHQAIADKLGINIGTSKSNLFKAKKKIRELLLSTLNEEEDDLGGDTSSAPSGGGGAQWETGMSRGPANTLGNSVWSDKVDRSGPANQWV